jgi:hypothetical protein
MYIPKQQEIEKIKQVYQPGMRIVLIRMNDIQAPLPGTMGSVQFVDDIGTIHMSWDNGSSLGLIPEVDLFRIAAA